MMVVAVLVVVVVVVVAVSRPSLGLSGRSLSRSLNHAVCSIVLLCRDS